MATVAWQWWWQRDEDSVVPTRPSSLLLFVFFLSGAAAFDRDAITLPSDLLLEGQLQAAKANDTIKRNTMW